MSDSKSEATTPSVADRSEEFVAIQGGAESSSAEGLLSTAYVLMWAAVFVFVWLSSRRTAALATRIGDLEEALKKADVETAAGSEAHGTA